jgi:hypothetical protein
MVDFKGHNGTGYSSAEHAFLGANNEILDYKTSFVVK